MRRLQAHTDRPNAGMLRVSKCRRLTMGRFEESLRHQAGIKSIQGQGGLTRDTPAAENKEQVPVRREAQVGARPRRGVAPRPLGQVRPPLARLRRRVPSPQVSQEGGAVLAPKGVQPAGDGGEPVEGADGWRVAGRQVGPVGGGGVVGPQVAKVAWEQANQLPRKTTAAASIRAAAARRCGRGRVRTRARRPASPRPPKAYSSPPAAAKPWPLRGAGRAAAGADGESGVQVHCGATGLRTNRSPRNPAGIEGH